MKNGQLAERRLDVKMKILVSHVPPHKTLDRAFRILRVGSRALRSFVKEEQPDLCLCGHIHEARGIQKLGRTIIVNPGKFSSRHFAEIRISLTEESPTNLDVKILKFNGDKTAVVHSLNE